MRDARRAAAPAAAALFGLATFAIGLGLPLVDPWNVAWAVAGGDVQFHFIGWHMFRHDTWRWPPGVIANLGHPVGTSIGFTDSIPLLAFLLKPLGRLVEGDIQYFGLWLLASYVLQGVFGALLLRSFVRSPLLQMLGAALFVMSPPFVFRYGHAALTAHWQLLAGLWLYFEHPSFRPRVAAAWLALSALAAATHPYLAMMVLVLGAAHHAAMAIAGREVLGPAVSLALSGAAAAATSWLSGYFVLSDPADVQATGLGHYSANLLAFVMPVEQASPLGPGPLAYATSGQYEGYAYLGLGGVVLAAIALVIIALAACRGRSLRPACGLPCLPLFCAAGR